MVEDLDSLTGAKIEAVQVRLNVDISAATLKPNATPDHPINWGVNLGYSAAGTPYRHTIYIPAVDQGLVDAGEFDDTDPLVIAFNTEITAGDTVVLPSDEYENDLTAFLGGATTFRSS
jgi:hypothetical protein